MFSSIGWLEIFVILVAGLIFIGPERLPRVIEDGRAALYAARKAIYNAKQELNGEFGDEFKEISEPISQIASWQRMGPRAALTKALFDGDEEFMDTFDPNKIMSEDTAGEKHRRQQQRDRSTPQSQPQDPNAGASQPPAQPHTRGEFRWDDIT